MIIILLLTLFKCLNLNLMKFFFCIKAFECLSVTQYPVRSQKWPIILLKLIMIMTLLLNKKIIGIQNLKMQETWTQKELNRKNSQ